MIGLSGMLSRYRVSVNPLRAERRVELVALLITLLLLLQLVYSVVRLNFLEQPEAIKPALEVAGGTDDLRIEPVTEAASQEIRSRPLFWPSRRPESVVVEEVVVETTAPSTELDKLRLVGIFGAGDSAGIITLVQDKKQRILLGEEISGWKLDAIAADHAVFTSGGQTRRAPLKPNSQKGEKK